MIQESKQWTMLLASMSAFLVGYNLTVIAPALLILTKTFNLDYTEKIMIGSSALVGNFIGALLLGHLSDRFGRKYMFLWDIFFFVIISAISAFSGNVLEIVLFRTLLGFGIGGDYPISSTLVAEHSSTNTRGQNVGMLGIAWTLGFFIASITGLLALPLGTDAWRYMFFAPVLPSFAIIILREKMIESPIWRKEVAIAKNSGSVSELFSKKIIKFTAYAASFWFLFDVVQYGISTYAPLVIEQINNQGNYNAIIGTIILAFVEIIGTIIGVLLIDRQGRRMIQIIGFVGITLSMFLAALVTGGYFTILILLLFALAVGIGPGILEFVYPPELFPSHNRATGAGFANRMSRLGAILGVFVLPVIQSTYGLTALFSIYGFFAFSGLIITLILAPETRNKELVKINSI